ncbi:MAG: ABC transporter substrate-binding protein [Planctomycetota bacterium]
MTRDPITLTRRGALGALVAGGVGFALFGPRGAPPEAEGKLVLQYWEKWTSNEGAAMKAIVDAFNASQDEIYVNYFSMSGIDQKALIAIAGGRPPDIVGLWAFNVPAYAEAGAIEPLDDMARQHGIERENYVDSLWPLLTHNGRLFAMTSTCGTIAMFYNRELFREVGLDPDRPPRTIAELDEAGDRLTARDSSGSLTRIGFVHAEPGWWQWNWGYHFGGHLLDREANRCLASEPEHIAGLEWLDATAARLGGARAVDSFRSGFGTYYSAQNSFLTGQVAMIQQGPWMANVINDFRPDMDYGVAPFPVEESLYDPDNPIGLVDSDVLIIPKGAKDPEASMRFIAFVQRPENIQHLAAAHCKNAPLKNMPEQFYRDHRHRAVEVHDLIANSSRGYTQPRTRVWPQFEDAMRVAFNAVWEQRSTPAEALAGVDRLVQARLDDVERKRRLRRDLA